MEKHGLQYGPSFRGVERIWRRNGEAIGRLRVPEAVASEASAYRIHPAVLDACFALYAGEKMPPDEVGQAIEVMFPEHDPAQLKTWTTRFARLFTASIYK